MLILAASLGASAQERTECFENDTMPTALSPAVSFIPVEYDGFWFEVPAGSIVTEENSKVAKYPDGSFGVSATTARVRGSNQKRALEVCRGIAGDMHLTDGKVGKFNSNGLKGAISTGRLEGQTVTVVVVPVNDKELTTVIIATPDRSDWTDHLLSTLRKK